MTTYQNLLHSVALRTNALVGSQVAELEATYSTAVLTSTNFKSANWPFSSFVDAILMAEEDFANAIPGNHPWRTVSGYGGTVTVPLASGATIPAVNAAGKQVVGPRGTIFDASDSTPLTEMPLDVITRRVRNANSHYVTPVYFFNIQDQKIYHTRGTVLIEVCIYDRATQLAAFNANSAMLLPDPVEPGIVARALSIMFRDGLYDSQAAEYRKYSDDALSAIRSGYTSIPGKSIPVPITTQRAA